MATLTNIKFRPVSATPETPQPPRHRWSVSASGDYAADCKTGENLAAEAIRHMTDRDFSPLLGWIAKAMVDRGQWTGVEIGFCDFIARCCISSA